MKLVQKQGKKKVYFASSIFIIVCIVIGISTWYIMEQNYKQKILDSIGIAFMDDASIEYGSEQFDFNSFIKNRIGEPEIQLLAEGINTMQLGKNQITYILRKDGYSINQVLEVEVKIQKHLRLF